MGCCKTTFLLSTMSLAAVAAAMLAFKIDMNLVLMRFFRDVARAKARKRLYGNEYAVMPLFLGNEEPIPLKTADDLKAEEYMTLTAEELAEYSDEDEGPLYLGINGRVYDVSRNPTFYGEDGKYNLFVGKDATHAFGTGCLQDTPECVNPSTEGFGEKEMKEIDRWVELYETHDLYTFVGFLVEDVVDKILEADQEQAQEEEEQEVEYL